MLFCQHKMAWNKKKLTLNRSNICREREPPLVKHITKRHLHSHLSIQTCTMYLIMNTSFYSREQFCSIWFFLKYFQPNLSPVLNFKNWTKISFSSSPLPHFFYLFCSTLKVPWHIDWILSKQNIQISVNSTQTNAEAMLKWKNILQLKKSRKINYSVWSKFYYHS